MHKYKLQLYICDDGICRAFYCFAWSGNPGTSAPDYGWSAAIVALIEPAFAGFIVKDLQSVLHQYSIDKGL